MTVRELYVNVLTEINKVGAPSLLLEDFIYFANKTVQQHTDRAYNRYDMNQQATDDLRVLKTSAVLNIKSDSNASSPLEKFKHYCELPADYMHLLTCIVEFAKVDDANTSNQCGNKDDDEGVLYSPARRLTADMYPDIIRNAYFKPTCERPYYFLNNVNDNDSDPVFPEANQELIPTNSTMDELIKALNGKDRIAEGRHSNVTPPIMEIRCGKVNKYYPVKAYVDYLKSPMKITLTEAQLDGVDTSQVLEFPDDVCYKLVNELTTLVLENGSDPRVQTNPAVNVTSPQTTSES